MGYSLKYKIDIDNGGFENILVNMRRRHLIEIFGELKIRKIVEVGCGTEPIFNWYKEYTKIQIIERSLEFCNRASKQLKTLKKTNKNNTDISIQNIAFEDCKKLDFPADMIVLSGILHEVDDVELFLKHLKYLTKGNEYIYVNVPNANSLHRLLAFHSGLINDPSEISKRGNFFGHKRGFFTMSELKNILIKSEFNIIDSGSLALKPFTNEQMDRLFKDNQEDRDILIEALFYPDKFLTEMGSELWVLIKGKSSQ